MKVEVELRDYPLLIKALFQYEEYLARELSLYHTVKERETIGNKFTEVSKLVSRIAAQAEQMLDRTQGKS